MGIHNHIQPHHNKKIQPISTESNSAVYPNTQATSARPTYKHQHSNTPYPPPARDKKRRIKQFLFRPPFIMLSCNLLCTLSVAMAMAICAVNAADASPDMSLGDVVARASDNGNACAMKHFWGEADCGNAHAQDGVYMTAFKKLGDPKTIRICREATSDCTKAYTVPEGAVWENPPNQGSRPGRESNSLALKLSAINPANKNTYYLVLARGGQGICINQRTDRANSIFTCDGDNGQKCDMIGLQDAHNQECGHQGKFRASFSDNWGGAKPKFVSLHFGYDSLNSKHTTCDVSIVKQQESMLQILQQTARDTSAQMALLVDEIRALQIEIDDLEAVNVRLDEAIKAQSC